MKRGCSSVRAVIAEEALPLDSRETGLERADLQYGGTKKQ